MRFFNFGISLQEAANELLDAAIGTPTQVSIDLSVLQAAPEERDRAELELFIVRFLALVHLVAAQYTDHEKCQKIVMSLKVAVKVWLCHWPDPDVRFKTIHRRLSEYEQCFKIDELGFDHELGPLWVAGERFSVALGRNPMDVVTRHALLHAYVETVKRNDEFVKRLKIRDL